MLELQTAGGSTSYQIPVRVKELLSIGDGPLDTRLDNLVVTFDIQTDLAAIYGRVTDYAERQGTGVKVGVYCTKRVSLTLENLFLAKWYHH